MQIFIIKKIDVVAIDRLIRKWIFVIPIGRPVVSDSEVCYVFLDGESDTEKNITAETWHWNCWYFNV